MSGYLVTIGAFDGVHLGHRWLLAQVVDRARQLRTQSMVVTFHPHPDVVLYRRFHESSLTGGRSQHSPLLRSLRAKLEREQQERGEGES